MVFYHARGGYSFSSLPERPLPSWARAPRLVRDGMPVRRVTGRVASRLVARDADARERVASRLVARDAAAAGLAVPGAGLPNKQVFTIKQMFTIMEAGGVGG